MAARIRKDDEVVVIAGRNKGDRGRVLVVKDDRVIVSGVNVVKRHTKPNQFQQGGILEKEAPIHISNVMPLDTKADKPTRVKAGSDKDGKKVRVAVKSDTVIG
ncbi:MAG: 50S ribosomal protein L24 [Polyangiales bacterium]|nr:50S ribosomal protein L24 [Myxococcales bacterium]